MLFDLDIKIMGIGNIMLRVLPIKFICQSLIALVALRMGCSWYIYGINTYKGNECIKKKFFTISLLRRHQTIMVNVAGCI